MHLDENKRNLQKYYDEEALLRNSREKASRKKIQRQLFSTLLKIENKHTLLEIGAGCGDDAVFFGAEGLEVTVIDLSHEMINICKQKGINAHALDLYDVESLGMRFDSIRAMNSLLHVPKKDFPYILNIVNELLQEGGVFYMGVYGGVDSEHIHVDDISDVPRLFSLYTEQTLKTMLTMVFDIVSYQQVDVGRRREFQAVVMRKRATLAKES